MRAVAGEESHPFLEVDVQGGARPHPARLPRKMLILWGDHGEYTSDSDGNHGPYEIDDKNKMVLILCWVEVKEAEHSDIALFTFKCGRQ